MIFFLRRGPLLYYTFEFYPGSFGFIVLVVPDQFKDHHDRNLERQTERGKKRKRKRSGN